MKGRLSAKIVEIDSCDEINWIPENDISDYCYDAKLIDNQGCEFADDADRFEIYCVNLIQNIIEQEDDHRELFTEEKFDEHTAGAHVEEEMEMTPP